ncbi:NmrA-like family protein [Xylariomycetidae sp. FL2044]|nr:NmrA-like family protein [Xylariomycetidae sp. FL2044]KAH9883564.1 NmrA-like family protein [Xylariomycetidae sp. FL2044]
MPLQTVALIGANGNVGVEILRALLSAPAPGFTVTTIQRASSMTTPSIPQDGGSSSINSSSDKKTYTTRTVDDALSQPSLEAAFRGQDAVVCAFPLRDVSQHLRICDAAYAAGVRRVIPADFGSCDPASARVRALGMPLFARKMAVREKLAGVVVTAEEEKRDFSYTSIVCGHFFDWGLKTDNFLHVDIAARRADVLLVNDDDDDDEGGKKKKEEEKKSSLSTLARVGEAVVRVLQREHDTRDRVLFVQSFCVSQRQVLRAVQRATGTGDADWAVMRYDADAFIAAEKPKADAGDHVAVENLVFALGVVDGNWEEREGFAMELLGLEDEDLDQVVGRVVKEVQG